MKNKNLMMGVLIVAGVGILYYLWKKNQKPKVSVKDNQPTQVAETDEIKDKNISEKVNESEIED